MGDIVNIEIWLDWDMGMAGKWVGRDMGGVGIWAGLDNGWCWDMVGV